MDAMRMYMDDEALEASESTLSAGLKAAVEAARAQGRVIIEVEADGEPLADEDLEAPSEDPAFCDELRFRSAEPRSLVRVTLLEAADALEQSRQACAKAADMLQTGQTAEALRHLGESLGTWESARRVVQEGCALLEIDIEGAEGLGPKAQAMIEALSSSLEEIKRALASEDWADLSDLLAFELDEQAQAWRDAMIRIADGVAR